MLRAYARLVDTPLFIFAVMAGGLVLGTVARFLVPGRQRLSLAETTIIGMIGAGVGGFAYNLFAGGEGLDRITIGSVLSALIASILVLGVGTWLAERFGLREDPPPSAAELIAGGESASVEFKSTARWNTHSGEKDPRMEMIISKTVAGFLNADGGTLIIGVDDDGSPVGLERDLSLMKAPDHDRYELWLTDHLGRTLGKPALAFVSVRFEPYAGHEVVVVTIEASDRPVFVDEPKGGRTADFYVRMGNSTRKMLTDEFADYQRSRWR